MGSRPFEAGSAATRRLIVAMSARLELTFSRCLFACSIGSVLQVLMPLRWSA